MNLTKLLCTLGLALAFDIPANAQVADTYPIAPVYNGGTVGYLAKSTNIFRTSTVTVTNNQPAAGSIASNTNLIIMPVGEFDYAGLTWAASFPQSASAQLVAFPSYDKGQTFAAIPIWQSGVVTNSGASALPFITNASIDVHGATTLAFSVYTLGSVDATNGLLEVNLKSPKYGAKSSAR